VSAVTGEGLPELLAAIEARLLGSRPVHELTLDPTDGAGLAWLYAHGEVLERREDEDGRLHLAVRVADKSLTTFHRRFGDGIRQAVKEN
ncbi:UNVERIFIED_CONTAM: GTPase HflX, partial [Bacteroidetes bacterium 56_B9]